VKAIKLTKLIPPPNILLEYSKLNHMPLTNVKLKFQVILKYFIRVTVFLIKNHCIQIWVRWIKYGCLQKFNKLAGRLCEVVWAKQFNLVKDLTATYLHFFKCLS
jgi:hypothetical protein